MDLNQRKLSKDEWNGVEVPVNDNEKNILNLIVRGFHDVNITVNNNISLVNYLKIAPNENVNDYLFQTYIVPILNPILKKHKMKLIDNVASQTQAKMKKADIIRLKNADKQLKSLDVEIFEFKLIEQFDLMLQTSKTIDKKWITYYYTIKVLLTYSISNINPNFVAYINSVLSEYSGKLNKLDLVKNGYEMIERNNNILKYSDRELYEHQKQLFTICKRDVPKLVLYIAPTGTGKTLSPIGLSEQYKVIFVCAARHVGLALAKNAISIGKKIAFAFGCTSSEDVRLHYFAAKEFITNKKTGGIRKVDNTVGDKVEIMISDIKSYIPAMFYMLAFNPPENIILYWDEPTITMDYEDHELHSIVHKNWSENLIPNIVLSSATLPFEEEISDTIIDFKNKFVEKNPEVHTIVSYDCKKTIPIINKEGFVEMPHYLYESFNELREVVKHCEKYKTILRYLDLEEAIKFIVYMNKNNLIKSEIDSVEHEKKLPNC